MNSPHQRPATVSVGSAKRNALAFSNQLTNDPCQPLWFEPGAEASAPSWKAHYPTRETELLKRLDQGGRGHLEKIQEVSAGLATIALERKESIKMLRSSREMSLEIEQRRAEIYAINEIMTEVRRRQRECTSEFTADGMNSPSPVIEVHSGVLRSPSLAPSSPLLGTSPSVETSPFPLSGSPLRTQARLQFEKRRPGTSSPMMPSSSGQLLTCGIPCGVPSTGDQAKAWRSGINASATAMSAAPMPDGTSSSPTRKYGSLKRAAVLVCSQSSHTSSPSGAASPQRSLTLGTGTRVEVRDAQGKWLKGTVVGRSSLSGPGGVRSALVKPDGWKQAFAFPECRVARAPSNNSGGFESSQIVQSPPRYRRLMFP